MRDDKQCLEVAEHLSAILDETAPPALMEHVAGCDDCRDLRHEAIQASRGVALAGADFRAPAGFADKLIAALEVAPAPASAAATTTEIVEVPSAPPAATVVDEALAVEPPALGGASLIRVKPARTTVEAAAAKASPKKKAAYAALAVAITAVAAGVALRVGADKGPEHAPGEAWTGRVALVARAAADGAGGLQACDASARCVDVDKDATIEAGATLKTDARTRAFVSLGDGTELSMDRGTTLTLGSGGGRRASLVEGSLVLDVAHIEGDKAELAFPLGRVEVLGTKLAVTATSDRASVEVVRGHVRVSANDEQPVEVRAGEEATVVRGKAPVVASVPSLSDALAWSDRGAERTEGEGLRGLGELRARKPGETTERAHAVRLAKHDVSIRVVDAVARTTVDETFANDTDEVLEGIYRFPMPPGAQIERLALEVDGELIEGAFVDRDRGAAIWRGAIQNAAPKAKRPKDEIVWVPGPWKDPALLEWQRGGRFELKIFPIPKRGSRRVVLTYTETVHPSAGLRRYTYPLAHDADGSTRIDSFSMNLQVLGADPSVGVRTYGYGMESASNDATKSAMRATNFVPAGDLSVEYALPGDAGEITTWAFQPSAAASTPSIARAAGSSADSAADQTAQLIASDASPYVAIALRPKLPAWSKAQARTQVIVVDASRSMVGERYRRATRLASSIVREMDRRDDFAVLACDLTCQTMPLGDARVPGAAAAAEVERFLDGIEPDGGSDLAAMMSAARVAAQGRDGDRALRVIYLGDGTPSVGPTQPGHLELSTRHALGDGQARVVAVALGADADTTSLDALARGGSGVVVPYVPGQSATAAALDALGASYGRVLGDVQVELPAGLTQVTPGTMAPVLAGGETFVLARMSQPEVSGQVTLRGKSNGEAFERSYPVTIRASQSAGNAFIPRMYAASRIEELSRVAGDSAKPTVIALSKRFSVASRYTSLLVLESEAMFRAFGLDRAEQVAEFTGEERAESDNTEAEEPVDALAGGDSAGGLGQGMGPMGYGVEAQSRAPAKKTARGSTRDFDYDYRADKALEYAEPPASRAQPSAPSMPAPTATIAAAPPPLDRGRGMVPMRKVYDRKVAFSADSALATASASRLIATEAAAQTEPDSRKATADLYALYSTLGRIGDAQALADRWSTRDALDPDALLARADVAARAGRRAEAVRILGGIVDLRPGDRDAQRRLASLRDAAAQPELACRHRITLAELSSSNAQLVSDAVRCSRAGGLAALSDALRGEASATVQAAIDRDLDVVPAPARLLGDVRLSATWDAPDVDVDVALIDAKGRRYSWMGSQTKALITSSDATSTRAEGLAVQNLASGQYTIELTRASSSNADSTVRGELSLRLGGSTQRLPFTLTGARAEVGTVRVYYSSRLVPLDRPW